MKKLPTTPRSRIRSALRQLFLRSRERQAAIKREHNTCQLCHRKGSVAKGKVLKTQAHHLTGVGNWARITAMIYEELLCDPSKLQVLCVDCHQKETEKQSERNGCRVAST